MDEPYDDRETVAEDPAANWPLCVCCGDTPLDPADSETVCWPCQYVAEWLAKCRSGTA